MSFTESEKQTLQYYDGSGLTWSIKHDGETSIWANEVNLFMDFLPGGDILEIGSGIGKEAQMFRDAGYGYVGIDPSLGLARIAKKRNPYGNFVNASISELPGIKHQFDGFWAAASLLHVPKNKIDQALQITRNSLYPAAYGFISLKEGNGEKVDPETGRIFSYYDMGEFYNILRKNGFGIVRSYARNINENLTWLNYYVQRI